ncbi:SLIT and NTRK-like protein 1 [Hemiscyllium ocellatum]|uniref:SLIT and NTRK-like protein 1 n=1 Tax=Hemiscyllium ocellatum TaxID=170820 RepID=UPI00296681D2|nr:SLIT and NTRK-like protein 1 [Hemiscyllium ocellatum]
MGDCCLKMCLVLLLGLQILVALVWGNTTTDLCEKMCSCTEVEGVLHINCEEKGISDLQHYSAPTSRFYQLFLHHNSLSKLFPNEFANFYNAVTLHLENNGLHDIIPGAFLGLQLLKRLHINNNKIKGFRRHTFLGLDDMEYLQADFNLLRDIDPGAFRDLNELEVLILNDNLLSSLPPDLFQNVPITHLDLRGNRLKTLPYDGILELIPGVAEILLDDNPWDCTCDLLPLKEWLEHISYSALIGKVVCEAPLRLQGNYLNETSEYDLCPWKVDNDLSLVAPPAQGATGLPATPIFQHPRSPTSASMHKGQLKPSGNWQQKTRPSANLVPNGSNSPPLLAGCPTACSCSFNNPESGLEVNCRGSKLESMADLQPKPIKAEELFLRQNNIEIIRRSHFVDYSSLTLLDLGNNAIKLIENNTFLNLTDLRWLYLDNNNLETLNPDMFAGLQNTEYLNLEFNLIQLILPGTFNSMPNLRELFLHNNLLKSLPVDVFSSVSLSKLSLHTNYFMYLPVTGVLDQLTSVVQIDLHGNPWDCSCNIIAFKQWVERMGTDVVVSELKCASPDQFWDRDIKSISNELMCPELYAKIHLTFSSSSNITISTETGTHVNPYLETSRVSISVLVPGLLLVFVTSAFTVVGMLVFILRNRKRSRKRENNSSASEINSLQTVCDSYWHNGPYHAEGPHRVYDCVTHSLSD